MKKLLLCVVCAVAVCMTINAQSSIQKSLRDLNRTMEEIERMQRNIDRITANTPRREARRAPKYDFNTGLKYKEKGGNVFYLETKELIMEVNNYTIDFFRADSGTYVTSISRKEFGRHTVARGLSTSVKKNITLIIEQDASNTMFQFCIGERTIMTKWAKQYVEPSPRYYNRRRY